MTAFTHRLTHHPLLRLMALVWLAAALLAGCSQEPKQRAAFIDFLQTRILDKKSGVVPILTKQDKDTLGDDYAKQYAVIQDFHEALNDTVSKPASDLLSKGSFNSIGDRLCGSTSGLCSSRASGLCSRASCRSRA